MQIKDVMTQQVELIDPKTTIHEASRMMRENDIGALPIADGDRLAGMVTDRDIVVRVVAEGKDPNSTSVREAMSETVLYCYEDQTTDEVLKNMGSMQIRRLPVVNRDKRLVGIVSLGDLSVEADSSKAGNALDQISRSAH